MQRWYGDVGESGCLPGKSLGALHGILGVTYVRMWFHIDVAGTGAVVVIPAKWGVVAVEVPTQCRTKNGCEEYSDRVIGPSLPFAKARGRGWLMRGRGSTLLGTG